MALSSPKIFHTPFILVLILQCDYARGNSKPSDHSRSPLVTESAAALATSDSPDQNGTANWPVPLPSRFHYYDLDGNGVLTLKELAKVTGTSRKDARLPFEAADLDGETQKALCWSPLSRVLSGDNRITAQEFDNAPWLFGDLPDLASVHGNSSFASNFSNGTISAQPRRRPGRRRGHRKQPKKKVRRQHQRKLKRKLASGAKSKMRASAEKS